MKRSWLSECIYASDGASNEEWKNRIIYTKVRINRNKSSSTLLLMRQSSAIIDYLSSEIFFKSFCFSLKFLNPQTILIMNEMRIMSIYVTVPVYCAGSLITAIKPKSVDFVCRAQLNFYTSLDVQFCQGCRFSDFSRLKYSGLALTFKKPSIKSDKLAIIISC